jgi:hypothetical protein
VAIVRERTIPTERAPLFGQVSANFWQRVCDAVSAVDPYGGNLGFLCRSGLLNAPVPLPKGIKSLSTPLKH